MTSLCYVLKHDSDITTEQHKDMFHSYWGDLIGLKTRRQYVNGETQTHFRISPLNFRKENLGELTDSCIWGFVFYAADQGYKVLKVEHGGKPFINNGKET